MPSLYGPSCIVVVFAEVVCTPDANSWLRVSVTLMLLPLHTVSVCAPYAASSAECVICSGGSSPCNIPFSALHLASGSRDMLHINQCANYGGLFLLVANVLSMVKFCC